MSANARSRRSPKGVFLLFHPRSCRGPRPSRCQPWHPGGVGAEPAARLRSRRAAPRPGADRRRPLTAAAARDTRRNRRSEPPSASPPAARRPRSARERREGTREGGREGGKRTKSRRSRRCRRPCPHPARQQRCGTEGCALTWSVPPRPAGREEEEEEAMLQRSQAPLLTSPARGRAVPGSPPLAGGPAPRRRRRPLRWSRAAPVPLLPRRAGREGRGGHARLPAARSGGRHRPVPPHRRAAGRGLAAAPDGRGGRALPALTGARTEAPGGGGSVPRSPPPENREGGCYRRALRGRSPPAGAGPPAPAPRLSRSRRPPAGSAGPAQVGWLRLLSACGPPREMRSGKPGRGLLHEMKNPAPSSSLGANERLTTGKGRISVMSTTGVVLFTIMQIQSRPGVKSKRRTAPTLPAAGSGSRGSGLSRRLSRGESGRG